MYALKQKCCQTTCCCLLLECFFLSLTALWKHSTWRRLEAGNRVPWTWTMKILGNKGKTCGGSDKSCNQTLWQWQIALTEIATDMCWHGWHILSLNTTVHYVHCCALDAKSHTTCVFFSCARACVIDVMARHLKRKTHINIKQYKLQCNRYSLWGCWSHSTDEYRVGFELGWKHVVFAMLLT